jgi:NAD(P)H dehydrogenase (quinone)
MNTLVVVAHPNPASFNKNGILPTVLAALAEKGDEVRVRDLYELNFNPVLGPSDFEALGRGEVADDVRVEQEHIRWANNIIVINPTWWIGRPAILQGYFDRVLTYGFAFEYGPTGARGLLTNDKALVINTAGTPEMVFDSWPGSKELLGRPVTEGTMAFCGIANATHLQFYGVVMASPEERAAMLDQVTAAVMAL